MKKQIVFITFLITITFFNLTRIFAQISEGGIPPSFINHLNDSLVDKRVVKSINIAQVMHEDSLSPGPLWAGRSIPVGLNMTNSGTWTTLADGSRIWRLTLTSTGAKAVAVCYDNFYIPEGGKLFLYNGYKNQVIGAYTYKNNPVKKLFSTEIIQGESVTLEYVEPLANSKEGKTLQENVAGLSNIPSISISEIVHIYRTVPLVEHYNLEKSPQFATSLSCEVNINCSEGNNWQKQKRGVAEIFLKNGTEWGWCSGDLINTTNNSGIPYLITAAHCYSEGGNTSSASDMLQWQFYFQYESATCANPSAEPSYNTLTGCVFKATSPINGGSDFCLVLINTAPPNTYSPYYNGWDHTDNAPTSGVGISHPEADIKKISTFTSTLSSATWNDGTNVGTPNAHWEGTWITTTNGFSQIQPGSSGSPLFNENNLQVGTCTGGTAASCALGSTFLYGKFYYHWNLGGSDSTEQLEYWLDPLGTNPNSINGYDPYLDAPPIANFSASPTTSCTGTIQFTDLSLNAPTSWEWEFGDGNSSTLQNPLYTYTSSGTFTVSLTATNKYGYNTFKQTSYITINLPTSPVTSGASRCGPGTVSLTASGSGTLQWYDAQTNGKLINTGTSYTTPSLTATTTYYVQNDIIHPVQSVGMAAKTSSGGYYYGTNYNGQWGLVFNVLSPLTLISVVVYANTTANRHIWLINGSDTLYSNIINIASGQQTLALNVSIPVGTGYQLGTDGQNNLWRDQSDASYPYTIANLISITGNNAGSTAPNNYYYFYNWQVQQPSCTSAIIPVTATVIPKVTAGLSISSNTGNTICKGTSVTFTAKETNGGTNPLYQWKLNNVVTGTNNSLFSSSNLNNGDIINCELTSDAECVVGSPAASNSITMTVNNVPAAPVSDSIISTDNSIVWNWSSVANATGYKWNTTDDYNTATDNGLDTSVTLTGLTAKTSYTIFVWAYNGCGNSNVASMVQSTLAIVKYTLSGHVIYDNKLGTPLNDVKVYLKTTENELIDSATTVAGGEYVINNLSAGKYLINCTTIIPAGGFSPSDALRVNRYYLGAYTFGDNLMKIAADVNVDHKINPADALLINRRYIQAISTFPAGNWLFEKDSVTISDNNDTVNIKGICYGDVNAGKYGIEKLSGQSLNTMGTLNAQINQIIYLPLKIERNTELSAFGLVLSFNKNDIEINDIISNIQNLVYNIKDDEVRIAWSGIQNNLSLNANDTLLTLMLKVKTFNNIDFILTGESVLVDDNSDELSTDILFAPKLTINSDLKSFSYNCYPNPFKDETIINYVLPQTEKITIKLTDILGREIETLVNAEETEGSHQVTIEGGNKQAGIYFYTINTKDTKVVQRLMILK